MSIKLIEESAEHHFLTLLEKLRQDSNGWLAVRVALSKTLKHDDIIERPEHIKGKIHKAEQNSKALAKDIASRVSDMDGVILYRFSDCDIIALFRTVNAQQVETVKNIRSAMIEKYSDKLVKFYSIAKDIYSFQKLADERMLSASLMKSYIAMADANRVHSIPLRRGRREDSLVMIVEDDRFTATYAANILNKEYEVVLSKTAEDAIGLYIEHAPDIVLIDIHLPGITGHDALKAIKKIDRKACIFMLSVDTVKENIVNATQNGATGFLKKPFTKDRLLAAVVKSPYIKKHK